MIVRRLGADDIAALRGLTRLFARAFEYPATYPNQPPDDNYLRSWIENTSTIALVAEDGLDIIGGLVAYILPKLEQNRIEVYIYDLAVDVAYRRRGIATALIEDVQSIASDVGAWVVYVQADYVDPPAIALYEKLGVREEVLHFDIPPAKNR